MKIRSITFFINPLSQDFNSYIQKLGHFAQNLKKSFESSWNRDTDPSTFYATFSSYT